MVEKDPPPLGLCECGVMQYGEPHNHTPIRLGFSPEEAAAHRAERANHAYESRKQRGHL